MSHVVIHIGSYTSCFSLMYGYVYLNFLNKKSVYEINYDNFGVSQGTPWSL